MLIVQNLHYHYLRRLLAVVGFTEAAFALDLVVRPSVASALTDLAGIAERVRLRETRTSLEEQHMRILPAPL